MQSTAETIEVLNDLIQINNHWIAGYEQAVKELKTADAELKLLFTSLQDQNEEELLALQDKMIVAGEKLEWVTENSGKIFNAWLDIKEIFTGKDRRNVLTAVEKAYKAALASENLPANLREMIENQKSIIRTSQAQIIASRESKM